MDQVLVQSIHQYQIDGAKFDLESTRFYKLLGCLTQLNLYKDDLMTTKYQNKQLRLLLRFLKKCEHRNNQSVTAYLTQKEQELETVLHNLKKNEKLLNEIKKHDYQSDIQLDNIFLKLVSIFINHVLWLRAVFLNTAVNNLTIEERQDQHFFDRPSSSILMIKSLLGAQAIQVLRPLCAMHSARLFDPHRHVKIWLGRVLNLKPLIEQIYRFVNSFCSSLHQSLISI